MIKSPRLTSTSKKLCFLFLFLAFTICLGVGFSRAIIHSQDFVAPYTGARCLLDGCNPYDIFELNREYYAHGGVAQELPPWEQEIPVYPPSTLLLISPFALSSFPVARVIWAILNSCSLILAVALVRSVCPTAVPWLSTLLLCCFLVINYKMLLGLGQIALPAISFFVISAVLFLKNRQTALATVLLMVSIAMKPQIGGLMVMYFLLKKIHRRQTWLGLVGVLGLSVTAIFTLELRLGSHVWFESLRANVATSMLEDLMTRGR